MAWKRSSVRTRPGPPNRTKGLYSLSPSLYRAAGPLLGHILSGPAFCSLLHSFRTTYQIVQHCLLLSSLTFVIFLRIEEGHVQA